MITFKAQYIAPVNLKHRHCGSLFKDYKASLVSLDCRSENDLYSLNKVNLDWDNAKSFADDICRSFNKNYIKQELEPKEKYYAITKQMDSFEKLNPEDILGVTQITTDKYSSVYIDYIQTHPEHQYGSSAQAFKHIGRNLLNSVIKLYPKCKIELKAVFDAKHFYEKHGFEVIEGSRNKMRRIR